MGQLAPRLPPRTAAAEGVETTFHRAIDCCADPVAAVATCIDLGMDRILTSGASANVRQGCSILQKMCEAGKGRISIMAGGGLAESNIKEVISSTGVHEVHSSAKALVESKMLFKRETVSMGSKDEDTRATVSLSRVQAMVRLCEEANR